MAPPQVNLNEKPPAQVSEDPLPEKTDSAPAPVVVTMAPVRRCGVTAEQRRQRKRCRVACCSSLAFILVLMLALATACLVYRMRHRKFWRAYCRVHDGKRVPEHVRVDHHNQLIYVKPEHHQDNALELLHEYNRGLIAFKNGTANRCYIDRLDETFEDGYARWQGFEEKEHKMGRTLFIVPEPIQVEVVKHIAGVHIYEHCGSEKVDYYWVMEVTEQQIKEKPPTAKYLLV